MAKVFPSESAAGGTPEAQSGVEAGEGYANDRRPTLESLLAKYGRSEVPVDLQGALRLAVAAHRQRLSAGVADREALNRSTALWALLVTDPAVALAAAEGFLDARRLQAVLHIAMDSPPPDGTTPSPLPLDDTLARALDEQLANSDPQQLDSLAVTEAILRSCDRQGGLLPVRLQELGVERAAALDGLANARAGRPAGFSQSVRAARRRLATTTSQVTAAELVGALGDHKPGWLPAVTLPAEGRTATVDDWLLDVAGVYDAREVLRSDRGIIDTELVLRGLVELEPHLLDALEATPEALRVMERVRPAPKAERKTEPSADVPARVDLLGRTALATALLDHLAALSGRGERSMMVHLDGAWGSGKSSLFEFIKREIGETGAPYLVVEVNAWREQRIGAQWWTLYRALRLAHLDSEPRFWRRQRLKCSYLKDVVAIRQNRLWPVVLGLLVVAVGAYALLSHGLGNGLGVEDWVKLGASVFVGAAGAVAAAYRFLVPVSPRSAKSLEESGANPMAEVRELFARSLRLSSDHRALFLVDDLDRCEAEYVVKFLEVMQTLVRDAPCDAQGDDRARSGLKPVRGPYALIAADGLWLRSAYENSYGQLLTNDVPGKPVGYRFLEKIFQMHIRLPSVEPATKRRYYESLLFPAADRPSHGTGRASLNQHDVKRQDEVLRKIDELRSTQGMSDISATIGEISDVGTRLQLRAKTLKKASGSAAVERHLHELTPFIELLDANPRAIRMFVNAVSMQTYLRFIEGGPVDISGLALWAVLETRWPELADHLRLHPGHLRVSDSAGTVESKPTGMPDPLCDLMYSPDVQAVLNSGRWERFDPDRIRRCTGQS